MEFIASATLNPNKHLKEKFVTNMTGSSLLDIFSLALLVPVLMLIRRAIGFNYVLGSPKKNDDDKDDGKYFFGYMASMTVDFLLTVIPGILIFTVLSAWIHILALLLTLFLLFCAILKSNSSSYAAESLQSLEYIKKSLSSFRVGTMMVTCLCILAVDFKIFPRKFAKTETYGTSWMDLGVGSFVLANALVSRQARNIHSRGWMTAFRSTCPLIILGLGRVISTTGVNYQVHVGEYGVHWNFFFTLAAVSLLTSAIKVHPKYCGVLGLFILVGYQISLVEGLNAYLLSDERGMNIISQNKEGIFSIFGYWGLYLVGVQLGYHLFFQNNCTASSARGQWARKRVCVIALILWLLTIVLDRQVEQVSRRMCNMAYVTLVMAVNFQVLSIFMLSEYMPGSNFTVLEQAFDRNLLASFLVANILTGLVNMSVDTLFASPTQALFILVSYAFVGCFSMGLADFYDFRLKFW